VRFLLLLVFPVFLAVAPPARASCPEERGLPRYSNLELLAAAEVVVLARPIDRRPRVVSGELRGYPRNSLIHPAATARPARGYCSGGTLGRDARRVVAIENCKLKIRNR
jgi:hypothetical protein